MKLQQVNDAREYFLSDKELQRLLHVLDTDNARVPCLAAKLLLLTGCRVGELMQCRYRDLALESDTPTLKVVKEHSKNGKARYVPLSVEALKVISQLPSKGKSEYLFTNSRNGERLQSIDKVWQRLRKEAGLPTIWRKPSTRRATQGSNPSPINRLCLQWIWLVPFFIPIQPPIPSR
jgi:integrase